MWTKHEIFPWLLMLGMVFFVIHTTWELMGRL